MTDEGLDLQLAITEEEGIEPDEVIVFKRKNDGLVPPDVWIHPTFCDYFLEWAKTDEDESQKTLEASPEESSLTRLLPEIKKQPDWITEPDEILVANHYFINVKELCRITQEKIQEVGSTVKINVRLVNQTLVEFGYQERVDGFWIATKEGKRFRRGNRWDVALVDDLVKELSVEYLTPAQVKEELKHRTGLGNITTNMLNKALVQLEYQKRVEAKKGYKYWQGTEDAYAQKKVKKRGVKLLWHPDVIDELIDKCDFSVKPKRRKKMESASKNDCQCCSLVTIMLMQGYS
ncbi:MAG: hypothetical protein F6K65_28355 [Moorea sp. SIO3C2]|nr:hypothetical protein [Moorena sp. SIO3C2]